MTCCLHTLIETITCLRAVAQSFLAMLISCSVSLKKHGQQFVCGTIQVHDGSFKDTGKSKVVVTKSAELSYSFR